MDKYHSEKHVQAMYILQHIIYTTQVYKGKQKRTITRLFAIIMSTLWHNTNISPLNIVVIMTPNVQSQMF